MSKSPPVQAGPTKRFFVSMLTRDIGLADAILDLLDNSIDGIVRSQRDNPPTKDKQIDKEKPYKGFWAKITANSNRFEIWDNCGGIPRDVAIRSAFMLGRPDSTIDSDIATVGMYGIGMKRAIFKMGRSCIVTAEHKNAAYKVTITPEWMEDDHNWTLPLEDNVRGFKSDGTKIAVTELLEPIQYQFDPERSSFLVNLRKDISRLFALIIRLGFEVTLNGEIVTPVDLTLLAPPAPSDDPNLVRPYVFEGMIDKVNVSIVVGFYRPLATQSEIDSELESSRSSDDAGWTVICNNRIVLHADKSAVTGWGTASVPKYHNQFISISGVVTFTSNASLNLPLNTTKRGIDTSSSVYLFVLDYMREGVKKFTDFTNKWKTREEETNDSFSRLERLSPADIPKSVSSDAWTSVKKAGDRGSARRFVPTLPVPEDKERTRGISFTRPDADVKRVANILFGDSSVSPTEVGVRCFDDVLKRGKK